MMKIEVEATPTYKIENKAVVRPRYESSRYPFDKMEVGQSFFMRQIDSYELQKVRQAASTYGKRNGVRFSVVKEGNGYRCGRVK